LKLAWLRFGKCKVGNIGKAISELCDREQKEHGLPYADSVLGLKAVSPSNTSPKRCEKTRALVVVISSYLVGRDSIRLRGLVAATVFEFLRARRDATMEDASQQQHREQCMLICFARRLRMVAAALA